MRQVILDTETTGLNPATGDRIIEIGCVEMIGRRLTDRTFHHYINPERDIDAAPMRFTVCHENFFLINRSLPILLNS